MVDLIIFIGILTIAAFIAWGFISILRAFEKNPLVGRMLAQNTRAALSWRPRKKNPLKRKNFTEYPLVITDGIVFEVLEAKRQRGRIWHIKINIFNITDETRNIKLLETVFAWKGREDFVLDSDTDYFVKPATGLISTSQMVLWSMRKPEKFIITYLNNGKPASVFINLTQEMNAIKRMKKQSLINKKEIEEFHKNEKKKAQLKISENEKNFVNNETLINDKSTMEKVADDTSKSNNEVDESLVKHEEKSESSDSVTNDEYGVNLKKQQLDKEEE